MPKQGNINKEYDADFEEPEPTKAPKNQPQELDPFDEFDKSAKARAQTSKKEPLDDYLDDFNDDF